MRESKRLEAAANSSYGTAQAARDQITSYQAAAFAAADAVSYNYTATFKAGEAEAGIGA